MNVIKDMIDAFCEELLDLHRLLVEAEDQCREIAQRRDQLKAELTQARAENERIQADARAAIQNADTLRLSVLALTGEKKTLQEELAESRRELDVLRDQNEKQPDSDYSKLKELSTHFEDLEMGEKEKLLKTFPTAAPCRLY